MNILEFEQGTVIYPPDNVTSLLAKISLSASSLGIVLCGVSLILLALTAILFAEWRNSYKNQLLIQLILARYVYTLVRYGYDIRQYFRLNVTVDYQIYLNHFFMVYTELTLVVWMYVYTKQMYRSLVHVFDPDQPNIWKVTITTWFLPGLVTLFIHSIYYLQNYSSFTTFILYLIIFKWPFLVLNAIMLIRILKSLVKNKKKTNFKAIILIYILIFVFCFQQLFVDIYRVLYISYIYKIRYAPHLLIASHVSALYHCVAAVMFWIFGNANTRKMWKNAILCKTPLMKTQLGLRTST